MALLDASTLGPGRLGFSDETTLDVLRLEVHADDLPPVLPIVEAVTTVNYARMRLGDREMLLPVPGKGERTSGGKAGGEHWTPEEDGVGHNAVSGQRPCRSCARRPGGRRQVGTRDPGTKVCTAPQSPCPCVGWFVVWKTPSHANLKNAR